MQDTQNLTVAVDKTTRKKFLSYCEEKGVKKGQLATRMIDSFFEGKPFTPEMVGKIESNGDLPIEDGEKKSDQE